MLCSEGTHFFGKYTRFAGGDSAVTGPRSDDIIVFGFTSSERSTSLEGSSFTLASPSTPALTLDALRPLSVSPTIEAV